MESIIYKTIENHSKKVIEVCDILSEVERHFRGEDFEIKGGYRTFAAFINSFCEKGLLLPVKASRTNGRNPLLYNRYRIVMPDRDKKQISQEVMHELQSLHPKLDKGFYFNNPASYKEDNNYVLMLSQYFLDSSQSKSLKYRCTMNERSFEILNDEKFLESRGKVILRRLGLSLQDLNCYKTLEAFFYILFEPKDRLNVLIIENKDTFYSVLKYLERKPDKELYGINMDMLIYGEGKKIVNSFSFLNEVTMGTPVDRVYYFGDLDFEGIGIFNSLASKYGKHLIVPHINLYKELIRAARKPPVLKTNQSGTYLELFLMYFDEQIKEKITEILYNGKYIPQEAVNFGRKKIF